MVRSLVALKLLVSVRFLTLNHIYAAEVVAGNTQDGKDDADTFETLESGVYRLSFVRCT
jgi:hypothetical protein